MVRPRSRRRFDDRGSTMIEVVVAISLLAFVAAGVVRHIGASQTATLHSRTQDEAVSAAYDYLEQARAFGCGVEVSGEANLAAKNTKCGGLGIVNGLVPGEVNPEYNVEVATAWAMSSTTDRPASCTEFASGALQNPRPNMLVRTIDVSWRIKGVERNIDSATVEALPGDAVPFNSEVRGALVVQASADSVVGLVDQDDNTQRIYRRPITHGTDECVWFPFLLAGTYQVERTDGLIRDVAVTAGSTVCMKETTWTAC